MECPPEDSRHVGVYRRCRALEGKAGYRAGGVAADAGQLPELGGVGRDDSRTVSHHLLGQPVQIGRSPVVAQTVPVRTIPVGAAASDSMEG